METHPPNTSEQLNNQEPSSNLAGAGGEEILGNSKNNNLCSRQSSTRWTPTTDQIRILKELYYNNGIRSPTTDQIQRISARLRMYGKIEGKNVFYWFQNHKARERQKKRFTGYDHPNSSLINMNMNMKLNFTSVQTSSPAPPNHLHVYTNNHKQLYPTMSSAAPGVPCSTSACSTPAAAGVVGVGQIGGCINYGSVAMEKSFRDCSISQGEIQNYGWVGVDQYSSTYHTFLDKRKSFEQHETLNQEDHHDHQEEEEEEDQETPELETLPLFPMHGDHYNSSTGFFKSSSDHSSGYYSGSCYRSGNYANGGSRASLELSLNSYSGWSMDLHH